MPQPRPRRHLARALAGVLVVLGAVPIAMLQGAPQAAADTTQFRGVNWARLGDNFHGGPLVLHGLSSADSYETVVAKANAIYTGFENNLGANTVRLPINVQTVTTNWWNSYVGVIDAATAKGFKVVLSYWDDGVAANGGRITNWGAFDNMWNTVVGRYASNNLVYFEPMNEPAGHSASDWANVVSNWINSRPSVPRHRIFVSGAGLNTDIKSMCADRRLDGTFLSLHHYTFFSGAKNYDQWVAHLRDAIGSCAARTVLDEFGAPMDTGLNYHDANSTDNFVRYFRATTTVLRELRIGSIYWPGLGGKIRAGQGDDWYAMQKLHGTGTNLTLSTPSPSGRDRLRYAWGLTGDNPTTPPTTTPPTSPPPGQARQIVGVPSGRCLTVPNSSASNGAQTQLWDCVGATGQAWTYTPSRRLVAYGNKCLDAFGRGTSNGTAVIIWDCNGQTNQQWNINPNGTITGVHSGLCLDAFGGGSANGTNIILWSCHGGTNQQWALR